MTARDRRQPCRAVVCHYKRLRAHQRKVYLSGGGMVTTYANSGKVELSYASAPYGEHALSAITAARAHINFLKRLEGMI